jgi:hypothetical protein
VTTSEALVAAFLGTVFLVSSVTKLRDPYGATMAVKRFTGWDDAPPLLARALAFGEAIVAVGIVAGLFLPVLRRPSSAAAAAALAVFTGTMLTHLVRGNRFPCGCFGTAHEFSYGTAARTLALAVAASWLTTRDPDWTSTREEHAIVVLLTVASLGAVAVGLGVARAGRIWRHGLDPTSALAPSESGTAVA